MLPSNRIPTHPGQILQQEFLNPSGITQAALAKHLAIPRWRISRLIHGKSGVTPQMAWQLAGALGTTPQFWLGLQTNYDLALSQPIREVKPLVRVT